MKLFKKKNQIVDERIENAENKIYKEAYCIIVLIAAISIVTKYILYGVKFNLVITEVLIILVSSIYCQVKQVYKGIYSDYIEMHNRTNKVSRESKNIIFGIIIGVIISTYFGIRSAILYGGETNKIFYFIIVFAASFMMYVPFLVLVTVITDSVSKKVSKKVNSKDEA